jgi:hypothetical protein
MPRPATDHPQKRTPGTATVLAGTVLLWLAVAPGVALGIDIDSCGQEVPRGAVAELRADLACGPSAAAVRLGGRATLNLNGFTIAGPGSAGNGGVSCGRRCTVNGPGEIRGFGVGISGINLRVTDVTVRFNSEAGVSIKGGSLELSNVVANDNRIGILFTFGRRLLGRDVEANDNELAGVWTSGRRVRLVRLTAMRNGRFGGAYLSLSRRGKPRLVESTVIDNAGLGEGFDVLAGRRGVRLIDSTCGRGARVKAPRGSDVLTVVGSLGCDDD